MLLLGERLGHDRDAVAEVEVTANRGVHVGLGDRAVAIDERVQIAQVAS